LSINNPINEIRECCGWSIKELSNRLEMPYRTAQNYCSGERKPPEWVARLVCEEIRRLSGMEEERND
jgi:DNA-binding transcriptional regulator YiaG